MPEGIKTSLQSFLPWGHGSEVKCLPSICKALASIPRMRERGERERERERDRERERETELHAHCSTVYNNQVIDSA
jgi:hypothetical protein